MNPFMMQLFQQLSQPQYGSGMQGGYPWQQSPGRPSPWGGGYQQPRSNYGGQYGGSRGGGYPWQQSPSRPSPWGGGYQQPRTSMPQQGWGRGQPQPNPYQSTSGGIRNWMPAPQQGGMLNRFQGGLQQGPPQQSTQNPETTEVEQGQYPWQQSPSAPTPQQQDPWQQPARDAREQGPSMDNFPTGGSSPYQNTMMPQRNWSYAPGYQQNPYQSYQGYQQRPSQNPAWQQSPWGGQQGGGYPWGTGLQMPQQQQQSTQQTPQGQQGQYPWY